MREEKEIGEPDNIEGHPFLKPPLTDDVLREINWLKEKIKEVDIILKDYSIGYKPNPNSEIYKINIIFNDIPLIKMSIENERNILIDYKKELIKKLKKLGYVFKEDE